ncbi:MAG: hypothetical protein PHZ17_04585 [Sulfurovum sp.]|nr:hypothetical protein [Sulfurovum sp.]
MFLEKEVFNDHFSTHYVVLGFELAVDEAFSLGTGQHETYRWLSVDALLKSNEVYAYAKDYFMQHKGITND